MEPLILPVRGLHPQIPESTFLAPNCTVVGDVSMGEGCSIWFNAVVRGDVNFIRIGNEVNIQDGAVIHGTYQKHGTTTFYYELGGVAAEIQYQFGEQVSSTYYDEEGNVKKNNL